MSLKGKKMDERLEKHLENSIKFIRDTLANNCRDLAQHLSKIECSLRNDAPHDNLTINDLGEVQSQGTIIDAKCGKLMSLVHLLRFIKSLDNKI